MQRKTIASESEAEIKEKKSTFIGLTFFISGEEEVKEKLELCKLKYPNAAHYCYAFIVDSKRQRASDGREPAGSAGLPILRKIQSAGLEQVLVIVVRYYGGVKLGVPGLIAAYGTAAAQAIASSGSRTVVDKKRFILEFDFEHERSVNMVIKKIKATILDRQSSHNMRLSIEVVAGVEPELFRFKDELRNFTVHEEI